MKNPKEKEKKNKYENERLLEEASDKLASIMIAWIEFNKNKDKNVYEKRK